MYSCALSLRVFHLVSFWFLLLAAHRYETRVGDNGSRLSGGQRQRIAIARAFLRSPRILLLDEATSSLDAESEAAVQAALDQLIGSAGATVVLVAHRLSTVMNADKIAVVDHGRIVEEGDHETLLKVEGGVYSRLVRKQVSRSAASLNQSAADAAQERGAGRARQGSKDEWGGGEEEDEGEDEGGDGGDGGDGEAKEVFQDDIDKLMDSLEKDLPSAEMT